MKNIFTVDLEDWYQGNEIIKFENKRKYQDRVEYSTQKLLELLDQFSVKATFFILAHIAEEKSHLVKEIQMRGHEIASHGYSHELIFNQSINVFFNETKKSKEILEDITGSKIYGYRASNWSITEDTMWALDVIKEIGFEYDSSIYPFKTHLYGVESAPIHPYIHDNGLIEIPPTVTTIFGKRLAFAGGFYLRFFPEFVLKFLHKKSLNKKYPLIYYIHPWEIDEDQPYDLNIPFFNRFIHYHNLKSTLPKLKMLFRNYDFTSILGGHPYMKKSKKTRPII